MQLSSAPLTQAQADALAAAPVYVSPDILTVASVLTQFPAGPTYRGRYVRVSDLFGFVDGVMRCGFDGTLYYWQPETSDYGRDLAMTGDMTITAHGSPTSFNLTGSILAGVTRTITLSPANGWPGAIKEFKNGLGSMLGVLNIAGVGLGSTVGLPLGGYRKFYLDNTGGALAWRQLV